MSLTKEHLIHSLDNHLSMPKKKSSIIIESLMEIMKKTLELGEDVLISGFGKFCVKKKGDRRGRNPATGKGLMLDARRVVIFKCSGRLKEKVNG